MRSPWSPTGSALTMISTTILSIVRIVVSIMSIISRSVFLITFIIVMYLHPLVLRLRTQAVQSMVAKARAEIPPTAASCQDNTTTNNNHNNNFKYVYTYIYIYIVLHIYIYIYKYASCQDIRANCNTTTRRFSYPA